ncbi:MAG: IS1182 family transposase [Opitutae bacterium]|jgi:transposase|nr:IS1182 family transposase [Opitutae bacterium]
MMGIKERDFKVQTRIGLEDLVPPDHFYRKLQTKLDLSFVRNLVREFYVPYGRASIDPVVFFKLQLIMLFEGFRSERQLMRQVEVNLAFRWYIGYDLDETVPDHSSLTKIRERYGLSTFRRFFENVVQLCIDAGLVWGEEVYMDGTRVEANAAFDSYVRNFEYELRNHLNILFPDKTPPELDRPESDMLEDWVASYQEAVPHDKRDKYISQASYKTSLTDADATLLRKSSHLGYHTHYVVDGGKNRIILGALVTPANIQDNYPMLDFIRWLHFRWQIKPSIAVGDSKYGTTDNIVALFEEGILPFTPRANYRSTQTLYTADVFRYDPEQDVYYCPEEQTLKKVGQYKANRSFVYEGNTKICETCPVRQACTTNKRGRRIHRSFFQDDLDRASALRETEAYHKAMRKRQVWVEPMFGEAKQWHGLYRFRLRRLWRVNIEALLIASVQNLKRLLNPRFTRQNPLPPATSAALVSCILAFFGITCLYFPTRTAKSAF